MKGIFQFILVGVLFLESIGHADSLRGGTFKLSRCMKHQLSEKLYELDGGACAFSLDLGSRRYRGELQSRTEPFVLNTSEANSNGDDKRDYRSYALFRGNIRRGARFTFDNRVLTKFRVAASVIDNGKSLRVTLQTPRFMYQGTTPLTKALQSGAVYMNRLRRKLHSLTCGADNSPVGAAPLSDSPPALPLVSPTLQIFARASYDNLYRNANNGDGASAAADQFNIVDSIYMPQLGLKMTLFEIKGGVEPAVDPNMYTEPKPVLDAYQSYIVSKGQSPAHVSHFLSGRTFNAGVIGLAYVGTICVEPDLAVGFSQDLKMEETNSEGEQVIVDYTHLIIAHEIGHNLNANHDDSSQTIMSSTFNTNETFSDFSEGEITAFVNSGGGACLAGENDPAPTPSPGDDDDDNGGGGGGGNGGGGSGGGVFDPNRPGGSVGPYTQIKTVISERIKNNGKAVYSVKSKISGNAEGLSGCSLSTAGLFASSRRNDLLDAPLLTTGSPFYLGHVDFTSVPEGVFKHLRAGVKTTLGEKKPKNRVFFRVVVRNCDVNNIIASDIKRLGLGYNSATASAIASAFESKLQ